jgi:hypoxia up-regulated 1
VVSVLAISVSASVIGIDFGSEFLKVSLISPGKSFVIIENTTTKRKTENALAFYNKERFYESEATNKRTRSPRNTYVFLNKFLGALANDEEIIRISKQNFEDYVFEMDQGRGTFAFKLENFNVDLK